MIVKNYYTCQVCGLEFESEQELAIKISSFPLCSNRCVFRLYYKIFASYSEEQLFSLAELLNIKDFEAQTYNNLVFSITKKYPRLSLFSINKQAQGSGSEKQAQKTEHKIGSGSQHLYIEMPEPIAEPVLDYGGKLL